MLGLVEDRDGEVLHGNAALALTVVEDRVAADAVGAGALAGREAAGRRDVAPLDGRVSPTEDGEDVQERLRFGLVVGVEVGGIEDALPGRELERSGAADDDQAWRAGPLQAGEKRLRDIMVDQAGFTPTELPKT